MLVDASVALKWFVPEADSETAVALLTDNQLSAPDLILVEVGNALWKAFRRGALDGVTFSEDVERLHEAFASLHPLPELTIRAAGIARELGVGAGELEAGSFANGAAAAITSNEPTSAERLACSAHRHLFIRIADVLDAEAALDVDSDRACASGQGGF